LRDAGGQADQRLHFAHHDGQVPDLRFVAGIADGAAVGLNHRGAGLHHHGFANAPDGEGEREVAAVADVEYHVAQFDGREALHADGDGVCAGLQEREDEVAFAGRGGLAHRGGAGVDDGDGGAGEHAALFILDRAGEGGHFGLRGGRRERAGEQGDQREQGEQSEPGEQVLPGISIHASLFLVGGVPRRQMSLHR
jgi:hypothetical protein